MKSSILQLFQSPVLIGWLAHHTSLASSSFVSDLDRKRLHDKRSIAMKSFFRLPFRTLSTSSSRMSCCAASFSTTTRPSWTRNRSTSSICSRCWHQQYQPRLQPRHQHQQRRFAQQLADDPHWVSEIDHPAKLVRTGNRNHGPGLIVLGSFACFLSPPTCIKDG